MQIEKLQLQTSKTLKLSIALIYDVLLNDNFNFDRITYMMQSYIKSRSLNAHGPLITSSRLSTDIENGTSIIKTSVIMQLTQPLPSPEPPYEYEHLIKTGPCLFVRFTGNPQDIQYASMKLSVYAFENGILLEGSSYMVFVNQNADNMIADIFMPIKQEGNA